MNSASIREMMALALAIILWFFVRVTRSGISGEVLAQMQITVPIHLKGVNERLMAYEISQPQAVVTVQGEAQAVASLQEKQLDCYVDLRGEEAGSVWPKVQVILPGKFTLVSVSPETINLKQAPISSKPVPIRATVVGPTAKGRTAGSVTVWPKEVRISGPEPLVEEVVEVRTRILLSGQSQSSTFELRNLTPVNADGQLVEAKNATVKVIPSTVSATVPIEAESRSVGVAISLEKVRVENPPGYSSIVEVDPPFVTLSLGKGQAPPESISTRSEVFSGSTRVESRIVPLEIPDGFEVIGNRSVKVRIVPTPIKHLRAPTPTPLPAGMLPSLTSPTGGT